MKISLLADGQKTGNALELLLFFFERGDPQLFQKNQQHV